MQSGKAISVLSLTIVGLLFGLSIGCGGGTHQTVPAVPAVQPQAINITVSPSVITLERNQPAQFSAQVAGTANNQVTWSVVEGNAGGTISSEGIYTAASTTGTFHVKATSVADGTSAGTGMVVVGTPIPPNTLLTSVWGSGPNDVWAVGFDTIYHWDGTQWTSTFIESKYGPFAVRLETVRGNGPNDVWTVGDSIALEFKHWDGTSWTDFQPNEDAFVFGLWGVPGDMWAVGDTASSRVYHWDGVTWTPQFLQTTTGQTDWMQTAWGSSPNDVWAAGGGDDTGNNLRAASVFHWDGTAWEQKISGLTSPILGLWGSGTNDIWAVGENGLIAHWDGGAWTPFASGTTQLLWNVWGSGPDDVWAVGNGGTVLHWNGTAWSSIPTSTTNALRSVWGSGPNDVWVVGDQVILHFPQ